MRTTALLLTVLLAACTAEKAPEVKIGDALPNLPLPPNATIVSREVGVDAAKFRLHSNRSVDQVTAYYREILSTPPYNLISDSKAGAGFSLYAEQPGKPSIWVTVLPDSATGGSFVDVAGAKAK